MQHPQSIKELFRRYLRDQCSPSEVKRLLHYFDAGDNEPLLAELIRQQLEMEEEDSELTITQQNLLDKAFENISHAIATSGEGEKQPRITLIRRSWFQLAMAACFLLFVAFTVFLVLSNPRHREITAQQEQTKTEADVAPGRTTAILTLADGKKIVLDTTADGRLAVQGAVNVQKQNGQITYSNTENKEGAVAAYNSITTAKGNLYSLVFADGSRVWLNAASSIRFPTFFSGRERRVELSGEGYFEVAKNPSMPFRVAIVSPSGLSREVEVLGTQFNVNAYTDEPDVKTTLLEGRIKVKQADGEQTLAPGQQALLTPDRILVKKDVDVTAAVAWKEGFFFFHQTDFPTLMRQVARWYDIEVEFKGSGPKDDFSGKISRDVPLSNLIKVLQLNDVHLKMEGKKIVVLP